MTSPILDTGFWMLGSFVHIGCAPRPVKYLTRPKTRNIPSPERPAPGERLQSFARIVLARAKASWSVAVSSWCESLHGSRPRPDGRYSARARDESLKLLQWLAAASTAGVTTRPS